jgi:hypothetical protein
MISWRMATWCMARYCHNGYVLCVFMP